VDEPACVVVEGHRGERRADLGRAADAVLGGVVAGGGQPDRELGLLGARQVGDRVEAFDLPIEDIVDEARDVVGRLRTCRCRRGDRHQVGVAVERVAPGPAVALDARAVADPVVGHLGDHIVGAGLAESSDL
jgi:hypothetical protein